MLVDDSGKIVSNVTGRLCVRDWGHNTKWISGMDVLWQSLVEVARDGHSNSPLHPTESIADHLENSHPDCAQVLGDCSTLHLQGAKLLLDHGIRYPPDRIPSSA